MEQVGIMEQVRMMKQGTPFPLGQGRPGQDNRAKDVDELQSTFIRNVSHEFRTPLGIIMGFTELLYEGDLGALQPEQEQALSVVMKRVNQLQKTVERIVILLAVESNCQVPFPVNLSDVAIPVVEKQRARAEQAGLELAISVEPNLPLVSGDPDQLQQAVDSLVENAIKFTSRGGKVEVKVYAEADSACLVVSDTGIGIPETDLGHIFSGFYQVDGSTTRQYDGLGLGLTLARAVVEAHGGRIEVESQAGEGSCFFVKLPTRGAVLRQSNQTRKWQH
jgi:signal transduction histidine kinase